MEITLKPTIKQHAVYEALRSPETDTIFFGGGAGGGKSWIICESRLINAILYPGYRSFIGRNELKRLMQSTYVTWTKVCAHHKIPTDLWKLNGQYNYIEFTNGSRIDLLDLKYLPSDPLYERFGSLEYTDGAIEEAGEVHFMAYDVLKSRLGRHLNDKVRPTMLITGNPKKNWTYQLFYKPHKEGTLPASIAFIQALYSDNEYTAESYGTQLKQISDKATKERLMFGNWEYDDDPNTLISYEAITDLFTNTIPGTDEKWLVVDVARYGSDTTVISLWLGLDWHSVQVLSKKDTSEVAEAIKIILRDEQIPYSHCLIDEDGIGGGVIDQLKGVRGFMANRSPFPNRITGKPDNFKNLKTQCAYLLSELANSHKLSISWKDKTLETRLIEELEQLKRKDPDKEGKLEIEPKEKMKELLGRSPDMLDVMIMRMFFEYTHPTKTIAAPDPVTVLLANPIKQYGQQTNFN
jgi:phage terminase large subunit